jgi:hypothetical protein
MVIGQTKKYGRLFCRPFSVVLTTHTPEKRRLLLAALSLAL